MPILDYTPSTCAFRNVLTGTTVDITVRIENNGTTDIIDILPATSGARFSVSGFTGTLNPGAGADVTVHYSPTALGADTGTLTITSDADNNPVTIPLTGTSVAALTKQLSVNPSSYTFPDTKVGGTSANKTFAINSTGSVDVTVSALAATAPFHLDSPPATPFTILAGASQNVNVNFQPTGNGYATATNGLIITSDAVGSPLNIALAGVGIAITPAYVVMDGDEEGFAAFRSTLLQYDGQDFDCEEDAYAMRWTDFDKPGLGKTYQGLVLVADDRGVCDFSVTAHTHTTDQTEDGQVGSASLYIFGFEDLVETFVEMGEVAAGLIRVRIDRAADDGPLSIVSLGHVVDIEVVSMGTEQVPLTLTPVFTVTGDETSFFAFGNTLLECDPEDLDCEEAASATRAWVFGELGLLDAVTRAELVYDSLGISTVTLTLTNRQQNLSDSQDGVFNAATDGKPRSTLYDIEVTGEILEATLSRAADAGPVSILGELYRVVPKGETKK